jgi:hypothetical protein
MARCAEGDQILSSVIAQSASWLNVMDLKIFHPPAQLTTPVISLQGFPPELAISVASLPGFLSKRYLHFFKKLLPLGLRKTNDQPGEGRQ